MQIITCILIFSLVSFSCNKDKMKAGKVVEIYSLKSYQTVAGKCQVDPSVSALEDTAIIKNQDILEYSPTNYQFKLTDPAILQVKTFRDFTPFAVTVDKRVIYYGFFKPAISSSSCNHSITMDIDWITGNTISLKLGYPGPLPGVTIKDERNNPVLIGTLSNQGKIR
jgi:hypothetical protein